MGALQLIMSMTSLPDPEQEEAFRFFDKGEKGHLTPDEFICMVQSLGETPTQKSLQELLKDKQDIDRDGVVAMMPAIKAEKKTEADVIKAFKVFDNRSDGHITVENFRQMMGSVGEKLTPDQVLEATTKAQEIAGSTMDDGSPAIKYEKYVKWMMGSATE